MVFFLLTFSLRSQSCAAADTGTIRVCEHYNYIQKVCLFLQKVCVTTLSWLYVIRCGFAHDCPVTSQLPRSCWLVCSFVLLGQLCNNNLVVRIQTNKHSAYVTKNTTLAISFQSLQYNSKYKAPTKVSHESGWHEASQWHSSHTIWTNKGLERTGNVQTPWGICCSTRTILHLAPNWQLSGRITDVARLGKASADWMTTGWVKRGGDAHANAKTQGWTKKGELLCCNWTSRHVTAINISFRRHLK